MGGERGREERGRGEGEKDGGRRREEGGREGPAIKTSAHTTLNFFFRLQVLNVSSNQLFSLPPLNPLEELNSVTELYAANNCLRENALVVIAG